MAHKAQFADEPQWNHPLIAKLGEAPKRPTGQIGDLKVIPRASQPKWRMYWLFWVFGMVLTGFIVPELHAILNKQEGDTLSENIRYWLHPDTPGGGAAWLSIIVTLMGVLVWLFGHIHEYWP